MPKIDVTKYIEQSGVRKARFGGYEPDDVRQAMQALCAEYEQQSTRNAAGARKLAEENAALQQHCQALLAQNQRLSTENAKLAGSSESNSRRKESLENELSTMQERNHSLNDQNAVLRLKNGDLSKENAALTERTEQAEAELLVKGRALDTERTELENNRAKVLADAQAEAKHLISQAKEEAEAIRQEAQLQAAAMAQAAKEQARQQAQNLVDAAAAEANEIQNAHQLRLNNLRAEVKNMQSRRTDLIAYLTRMGNTLLQVAGEAAEMPGATQTEEKGDAEREELQEIATPSAQLDFSADALADTVAALRKEAAAAQPEAAAPAPVPVPQDAVQAPEEPAPAAPAKHRAFTLLEDEPTPTFAPAPTYFEEKDTTGQTGPALTEVPGAIFSSPIVRKSGEPIMDEIPPTAAPRAPVLPDLTDDEEDEENEADAALTQSAQDTPARKKAVCAVRALHRLYAEHT